MDPADGIYEKLLNRSEKDWLESKDNSKKIDIKDLSSIEIADSSEILSSYLKELVRTYLDSLHVKKDKKVPVQIDKCNSIIRYLAEEFSTIDSEDKRIPHDKNFLLSLWSDNEKHERPSTPISCSSLFTGGSNTIALYEELKKEIVSCDEIFFLVSFIKNSGINQIMEALRHATDRNVKLKILTTTYMGVTEKSAVDKLARLKNTSIKITYDTTTTRLHAKAYIFKRRTDYNVAFIESSNLSKAAISDGMEWNVKLTSHDVPQVFQNIEMMYNTYWNSGDFEEYDPDREECSEKLRKNLQAPEKSGVSDHMLFDIRPYPYQIRILADLESERESGNCRNLVVAATGTGKTVISAFDYKNCRKKGIDSFLFVAHRDEILEKSLKTYRNILGDQNFGRRFKSGDPVERYLFVSIQTLNSVGPNYFGGPDYFDYIVVDEVHHAAAISYEGLFEYFRPKVLLGLTATPDRMDGLDIYHWFDNKISSEVRLSDAINRELVVPFQYYGITDDTDLSAVKYINGHLDEKGLQNVFEGNKRRAQLIVNKVKEYYPEEQNIKGLGFCVSIEHAKFMAKFFTGCGYPSICVTSETDKDERQNAIKELESGETKFIFTVNLYNEGVDIPPVNLELMLRPTESLTVFVQQLGRGLRKYEGKTELTVLDFVAQADKRYKVYAKKLDYMSSKTTQSLKDRIENGFSGLPAGCSITLEKKAKEYVINTIESSHRRKRLMEVVKNFIRNNRRLPNLKEFLGNADIGPNEIYGLNCTFTSLCADAEGHSAVTAELDKTVALGLKKMCFMNTRMWFDEIGLLLAGNDKVSDIDRNALMLYYTFNYVEQSKSKNPVTGREYGSLGEFVEQLRDSYRDEILQLLEICKFGCRHNAESNGSVYAPFEIYGSYYQQQIFAAIGKSTFENKQESREGVFYDKDMRTDYFFITLNKSEKDFSPTTRYNDYAMNERLFHWESQSRTTIDSPTGKRYVSEVGDGRFMFFVRPNKKIEGIASPFIFLGTGRHISHDGSAPIKITWELDHTIPDEILSVQGTF